LSQDDVVPGAGVMVGFGGPYFTIGAITPYIGCIVIDDGSNDPTVDALARAMLEEIKADDDRSSFLTVPAPKYLLNLITHDIYNN
jgi:hypothetical protein